MNKKLTKTFFILLPISLGVFLIWYSLSKLTPSDVDSIKSSFKAADYRWVLLSLFLGVLSHLSRAYRWLFMLEPLGFKPKYYNALMTVLIAYLMNLGIPRSGEIARATAISKYENIPFEKAFGTIVAERVADVIMLLLIIAGALFTQFDLLKNIISTKIPENPLQSTIIIFIVILCFLLFLRMIKNSNNPFFIKVRTFFSGLFEGVKSILKMRKKWAFIFHTIFIWTMYVLMFYTITFAIPETNNLPLGAILTGFVVGSLSIAATNGGLGTYPLGVQQAIILYGIAKIPALAFGWIMWTAQTLMILVFGGISFILLPLINKQK